MKNRFFTAYLLTLGILSLTSCKQDDISDKINAGENFDERNVVIRYNAYFNGDPINKDSVYYNMHGEAIKFEEFSFLVSNFHYISATGLDTITMPLGNISEFTMPDKATKIGFLPQASYNGNIYFDCGISDSILFQIAIADSLAKLKNDPPIIAPEMMIKWFDPEILGFGTMRARGIAWDTALGIVGEANPTRFDILIGGIEHTISLKAEANYTINTKTDIIYILDWDIEDIFDLAQLTQDSVIKSSVLFPNQFQIAEDMRDTLQNSFFIR